MNIIVTGFVPFQNHTMNPSYEVVTLLPKTIKGHNIIPVILPVDYEHCFDNIQAELNSRSIDGIIMLGLANDRDKISIERVAINVKSSKYPDNSDAIYHDAVIVPEGKNAYFSRLPIRKIESRLNEKHIPVAISSSAGTYVCNTVMYKALHHTTDIPVGFIHLPRSTEMSEREGSLPITVQLEAVIDVIKITIEMEELQ